MADEEERRSRMGLSCVVEAGDLRLRGLLRRWDAVEIWQGLVRGHGEVWAQRAQVLDLDAVIRAADGHGIRFVIPGDAEWPQAVEDLDRGEPVQGSGGAPVGLWVRGGGSLADAVASAVAVVGSRASTAYGDRVAADLGAGLVQRGHPVVSGGAFGIDAAAHRGALAEGGPTVAVLAGGLDELYPRAHTALLERVAEAGVLVSEAPPGAHPTRHRFITRNRIIAALSSGVVLVEAAARSGARNTVTWATTCRRPVMAVPGPVGHPTSVTPHRLIREGEAVLVDGVDDVCELIAPMGEALVDIPRQVRLLDDLDEREKAVYEVLPSRGSRDTGEVALRAGVRVPEALAVLEALRTRGLAASAPDGGWRVGPVRDRPVRT